MGIQSQSESIDEHSVLEDSVQAILRQAGFTNSILSVDSANTCLVAQNDQRQSFRLGVICIEDATRFTAEQLDAELVSFSQQDVQQLQIITKTSYTPDTISFSKSRGIQLIDGIQFRAALHELPGGGGPVTESHPATVAVSTSTEEEASGGKMTKKQNSKGGFVIASFLFLIMLSVLGYRFLPKLIVGNLKSGEVLVSPVAGQRIEEPISLPEGTPAVHSDAVPEWLPDGFRFEEATPVFANTAQGPLTDYLMKTLGIDESASADDEARFKSLFSYLLRGGFFGTSKHIDESYQTSDNEEKPGLVLGLLMTSQPDTEDGAARLQRVMGAIEETNNFNLLFEAKRHLATLTGDPEDTKSALLAMQDLLNEEGGLANLHPSVQVFILLRSENDTFFRENHDLVTQIIVSHSMVEPWLKRLAEGMQHLLLYEDLILKGNVSDERVQRHRREGISTLERAWSEQSGIPHIAAARLSFNIGVVDYPEEDKVWFERAFHAQADYTEAYDSYLACLVKLKDNDYSEIIPFGKLCLESGRFDTLVPFVFLSAHGMRASALRQGEGYWKELNSEAIAEIEKLFDGYRAEASAFAAVPHVMATLETYIWFLCGEDERMLDSFTRAGRELSPGVESMLPTPVEVSAVRKRIGSLRP